MLQKITAICSISSFLLGIYTTLADNPEWQRDSLFGFAFLCLLIVLVSMGHKRIKGTVTLKGTQHFPYGSKMRQTEVEVFYSRPFKNIPNLTIKFQKSRKLNPWGQTGIGTAWNSLPKYSITEQRTDGFNLKVLFLPAFYDSVFKWRAVGDPEVKDENIRWGKPQKGRFEASP